MAQSETLTFLFTDLVDSTGQMQTVGDQTAHRLFQIHHKALSEAVSGTGGEELEWLGDGMLASFSSAADAVRCAISMQQRARRPVAGARFEIRIGINLGEVSRREGGYFGTPIVIARRLCDRASAGQILCSRLVGEILAGRHTFNFHDLGAFELKGIATPVGVSEVIYKRNDPAAMLQRTPFVGRIEQFAALSRTLTELEAGRGSVAMVRGEAGIGKSRMLAEFADYAQQRGATVLQGACCDGEWQAAYHPFAEAIVEYSRRAPAEFAAASQNSTAIIARIAPALEVILRRAAEPLVLDKEEERVRLFDAVSQFLIGICRKQPLILILDDLHWADRGTVAMLSHVARFATVQPILVVGAYRDAEVDGRHPLNAVLASLSRMQNFKSLTLVGLQGDEVAELLEVVGDQSAPDDLVQALHDTTNGNPLFIREILLHLLEERKILRENEGWNTDLDVEELDIPEGVRSIIGQRLARLSEETRRLLAVGSGFKGAFSFNVAAAAAELDEETALAAIDEAMAAQVLRPAATPEMLDFTHALIRHTLYADLNPARRSRLHRKIALQMEQVWGAKANSHAAEVAYQFWRGANLVGAERGADYAITAAENAEVACAHDEVVSFLRIAIDLLPRNDARRAQLLVRLGLVLPWTLKYQEGVEVSRQAAALIETSDGANAAADFLENAARAMHLAGRVRASWELALDGLRYAGARRDFTWASLSELNLAREDAENPDNPGIIAESPRRQEVRAILKKYPTTKRVSHGIDPAYESRQEILNDPEADAYTLVMMAGELRRSLRMSQEEAPAMEKLGRLAKAMTAWNLVAFCHLALGNMPQVQPALDRAFALYARATGPSFRIPSVNLNGMKYLMVTTTDEGWDSLARASESRSLLNEPAPENKWSYALVQTVSAVVVAHLGRTDLALQRLASLPRALELASPSESNVGPMACDAVAALWFLNRTEYCTVIERALHEKVIAPDFRFALRDARLSLARICALQERYAEAEQWFEAARKVLDEQGALPLRAIVDFDQGLMYTRRGDSSDTQRARSYFEEARRQFASLGMNGWLSRIQTTTALTSKRL